MKISAEDFARHYASMPDEELLLLDREELVSVARECYDKELARRKLEAANPPDVVEPGESLMEAVLLESYTFPDQAQVAYGLLKSARIPCFLNDEGTSGVLLSHPAGAYRLMVPPPFVDQARAVLDENRIGDGEAPLPEPWDGELEHKFAQTNGVRMHYVEAGSGPLVLLCHGFPESWYAWRHQLKALADAGYRAVAPDLRGYGQTDRPDALEAYDIFQLTGDVVGLMRALDEDEAVIVGHDWGAWVASHAALLRPDLFRAVALLSVPFVPRRTVNESQWEQQKYPGKVFYQATFRSPMAEQYFSSDVRARLLTALWTLSGDIAPEHRWLPARDAAAMLTAPVVPSGLPPWLAREDVDFLEAEFTRTGFTGGLNYYRNMDRNWALTPFLDGAKLLHRTLFIAGEKDPVLEFLDEELDTLETNVPNLWKSSIIDGAGHWIQQERPDEVNELLLAFLSDIEAGERAR